MRISWQFGVIQKNYCWFCLWSLEYVNWGYQNSLAQKNSMYKIDDIYMFLLVIYCWEVVNRWCKCKLDWFFMCNILSPNCFDTPKLYATCHLCISRFWGMSKTYKMSNCLTLLFSDELFQDIATDYVMSGMPNGTHAMLLLPSFCGIYCYYSLISKYLFFQWIIERHMWCVAQIGICVIVRMHANAFFYLPVVSICFVRVSMGI